jgi:hypothetical protein
MNKMNFTTINKNNSNNNPKDDVYSQPSLINANNNLISFRNFNSIQYARMMKINSNNETKKEIVSTEPEPKKMKWGEPTWFLFHTLAYKIKDDNFQQLRVELLNIIHSICANLPCPMCSGHAVEHLKSINFLGIRTKKELINALYNFHNEVNKKKGFAIFPYDDLDSKYSGAVTKNIIFNFILHYQDKHRSVHMIANDMFRARQVIVLKDWFNNNFKYFQP